MERKAAQKRYALREMMCFHILVEAGGGELNTLKLAFKYVQ